MKMNYLKEFILMIFTSLYLVSTAQNITLVNTASGFNDPVDIKNAGDDRLFIVEQGGLIKILDASNNTLNTPFLDVTSLISTGSERGLLSIAFPNDYSNSGNFYIYYTNTAGNSTIARYNISSDPNVADPNGTVILTFSQPFGNHNAGCMQFGDDGFLYIASGDGGSGGDPGDRAQDNTTLLGKLLRIDVTGATGGAFYNIPSDNPFANTAGEDEIFSTGLRNPWKFSFDSQTGNIWIADVGQNMTEEINSQPVSNTTANYGWRCYEGNNSFNPNGNCPPDTELVFPIAQYNHTGDGLNKCSITGGYVYRGSAYPNLQGTYFFADFCSNEIGMLDSGAANPPITYSTPLNGAGFSTFGLDQNNELYVAARNLGEIYRITDATAGLEDVSSNLNIYPNPATSQLFIEDSNRLFQTYEIYDPSGKLLLDGKMDVIKKVDITTLNSGVYFLKIQGVKVSTSTSFLVR
ncbi:MAG: PQQ-dependent sugar dehydrogenase [Nonlabens sp.]